MSSVLPLRDLMALPPTRVGNRLPVCTGLSLLIDANRSPVGLTISDRDSDGASAARGERVLV
jgi:hypothetical protein